MRSQAARTAFTIASFAPLVGIFGLSAFLATTAARHASAPASQDEVLSMLLAVLIGAVAIAFTQIALGIVVALHVTKRPDLGSTERGLWTIACIFVGSLALPIFSFVVLPRAATLPPAPPTR